MKLLFSSKVSYNANIKLIDKDEIIQSDQKVAETLDRFFKNSVFSSKLNANTFIINKKRKNIQNSIGKVILKYQFHPSILVIKEKIKNTNNFRFKHVMLPDINNESKGLNPNKATTRNNIPPKILRQSAGVTANTLHLLFKNTISNSEFPENVRMQ